MDNLVIVHVQVATPVFQQLQVYIYHRDSVRRFFHESICKKNCEIDLCITFHEFFPSQFEKKKNEILISRVFYNWIF